MNHKVTSLASGIFVLLAVVGCGSEKEAASDSPVKTLGEAAPKPKETAVAAPVAVADSGQAIAAKLAKAIERTKDGFDRADLYAKAKAMGANGKPLLAVLQQGLKDSEPVARASALEAIAAIDVNAIGGALVAAFADRDAEVRARAFAVMELQPTFDIELCFKAVGDEIDSALQLAGMKLLEKHATAAHGSQLVKLLGALDPKAAAPALQLTAKLGLKQAAGRVAEFVNSHDEDARCAAADALASLGVAEKDQLKALVRALEDDALRVRKSAFAALKKLSGKDLPFNPDGEDIEREDEVKAWKEAVLGR
jgi:hypothetical protein